MRTPASLGQHAGAPRPDPGHAQQLDRAARRRPRQLVEQAQLPGADDLADLAREVLADARDVGQPRGTPARHRPDGLRVLLDRPRGVAVGADAERVRALDVEQLGDLAEDARHLGVLDAGGGGAHAAPAPARWRVNHARARCGDLLERARLLEQVRRPGDDLEARRAGHLREGVPVEPEDDVVVAAHEEQRRRGHERERLAGHVRAPAARDDGGDVPRRDRGGPQRRRRARAGAEVAHAQAGQVRSRGDEAARGEQPPRQQLDVEARGGIRVLLLGEQVEQERGEAAPPAARRRRGDCAR